MTPKGIVPSGGAVASGACGTDAFPPPVRSAPRRGASPPCLGVEHQVGPRLSPPGAGATVPAAMTTYLSGIQPSGFPHLGNYFGAIRQHIELQVRLDQ